MIDTEIEDNNEKKLENKIALTITVFAAFLAINGLFGGKYGDDEMIAHQKQTQMFTWYQSKGQKKMLAENKKDIIEIFEKSGDIKGHHLEYLDSLSKTTERDIKRYGDEQNEIRVGSIAVGKSNWVQEQDGELGKIIGAEEYKIEADKLGSAGDFFDYGDLALNLSLVLGAVSLILNGKRQKLLYLNITFILGIIGGALTTYAMFIAMS